MHATPKGVTRGAQVPGAE